MTDNGDARSSGNGSTTPPAGNGSPSPLTPSNGNGNGHAPAEKPKTDWKKYHKPKKNVSEARRRNAKENLAPYHWKPGQSGNPKGKPPGTLNFNTELEKALREFRVGEKTYLEAILLKSLSNPVLAAKVLDKILQDATPRGSVNITNENNVSGTYETLLAELRAQQAQRRPGMEESDEA